LPPVALAVLLFHYHLPGLTYVLLVGTTDSCLMR
jgi:hypothetical protein